MKLALYFFALFTLSQSASLVRWAAAPPDVIGFWRLTLAALLLLPVAWHSRSLHELWAARRDRVPYVVLSAFFFFGHLWTFTYAAQNTRIAHAMILFASNPLWTSLGNKLFFKEHFGRRLLFSYVLALSGIVLLLRHSLSFETGLVTGDFVAILSAILFSGYILSGKKVRKTTSNFSYSFLMYAIAGALFGLSGALQGLNFTSWGSSTWIAIAALIAFPTFLGHALFSWLMKFMNINLMSCGKLLEPVLAALVAAVVFREPITVESQLAFVLTAAGVLFLFVPLPRSRR